MFNDYIDVRVYQAPSGDGRSKQLVQSGDKITRYVVKSTSVVYMTKGARVDYIQVR